MEDANVVNANQPAVTETAAVETVVVSAAEQLPEAPAEIVVQELVETVVVTAATDADDTIVGTIDERDPTQVILDRITEQVTATLNSSDHLSEQQKALANNMITSAVDKMADILRPDNVVGKIAGLLIQTAADIEARNAGDSTEANVS